MLADNMLLYATLLFRYRLRFQPMPLMARFISPL